MRQLLDRLKLNDVWVDGYGHKYICWYWNPDNHGFISIAENDEFSFCPRDIHYFTQDGYDRVFNYPSISKDVKEKSRLVKKIGAYKFFECNNGEIKI